MDTFERIIKSNMSSVFLQGSGYSKIELIEKKMCALAEISFRLPGAASKAYIFKYLFYFLNLF